MFHPRHAMPNAPRKDNPTRQIRVDDTLWHAAAQAAEAEGTKRSTVVREALQALVDRVASKR
jgi:predicted transcriptional regulator